MLCFIDESGDPGRKIGKGSSPTFTITLVIFQDRDEANLCDSKIDDLRKELSLPSDYEFHFVDCSDRKRIKFFECVSQFDFFYLSITINKALLYGEGFKFKDSFYKYTCGLVFENAKPYLENATVVFDGSGSRKFKQQLQTYLKKRVNESESKKLKKIKIQTSHTNNLIQLADMVCGAIAYSFKKKKKNGEKYRDIISHREIYCQVWPKRK